MLLGCKRAATCGKRLRQQQHIWRCSKTKSNATATKHQAQWGLFCSVQIAFHTSIEEGMRLRQYIYQTITLYHNGTTVPQLYYTAPQLYRNCLYHNCTTLLYESTAHKPHRHTRHPLSWERLGAPSNLFWSRLSVVHPILVTLLSIVRHRACFGCKTICWGPSYLWSHSWQLSVNAWRGSGECQTKLVKFSGMMSPKIRALIQTKCINLCIYRITEWQRNNSRKS